MPPPEVPFSNSYWVTPGLLPAGRHPGDADQPSMARRISSMLRTGIRTFIDLTEEGEINENAKPVP